MDRSGSGASSPDQARQSFPEARRGYARRAVDDFVADVERRLHTVRDENSALVVERDRLQGSLDELTVSYQHLQTATVDERSSDILRAAADEAAGQLAAARRTADAIVHQARREAEVIDERSRQELAWGRRRLRAERAALSSTQPAVAAAAAPVLAVTRENETAAL